MPGEREGAGSTRHGKWGTARLDLFLSFTLWAIFSVPPRFVFVFVSLSLSLSLSFPFSLSPFDALC